MFPFSVKYFTDILLSIIYITIIYAQESIKNPLFCLSSVWSVLVYSPSLALSINEHNYGSSRCLVQVS